MLIVGLHSRLAKLKETALSTEQFRAHKSMERRLGMMQSDVFRSQRVCRDLDHGADVQEAAEPWFWPPVPKAPVEDEEGVAEVEEEDDEPECEIPVEDQLVIITTYLRRQYFYCLWCGHSFNSSDDLNQNCPGSTREDHD